MAAVVWVRSREGRAVVVMALVMALVMAVVMAVVRVEAVTEVAMAVVRVLPQRFALG